jgi:hypothetical protein
LAADGLALESRANAALTAAKKIGPYSTVLGSEGPSRCRPVGMQSHSPWMGFVGTADSSKLGAAVV